MRRLPSLASSSAAPHPSCPSILSLFPSPPPPPSSSGLKASPAAPAASSATATTPPPPPSPPPAAAAAAAAAAAPNASPPTAAWMPGGSSPLANLMDDAISMPPPRTPPLASSHPAHPPHSTTFSSLSEPPNLLDFQPFDEPGSRPPGLAPSGSAVPSLVPDLMSSPNRMMQAMEATGSGSGNLMDDLFSAPVTSMFTTTTSRITGTTSATTATGSTADPFAPAIAAAGAGSFTGDLTSSGWVSIPPAAAAPAAASGASTASFDPFGPLSASGAGTTGQVDPFGSGFADPLASTNPFAEPASAPGSAALGSAAEADLVGLVGGLSMGANGEGRGAKTTGATTSGGATAAAAGVGGSQPGGWESFDSAGFQASSSRRSNGAATAVAANSTSQPGGWESFDTSTASTSTTSTSTASTSTAFSSTGFSGTALSSNCSSSSSSGGGGGGGDQPGGWMSFDAPSAASGGGDGLSAMGTIGTTVRSGRGETAAATAAAAAPATTAAAPATAAAAPAIGSAPAAAPPAAGAVEWASFNPPAVSQPAATTWHPLMEPPDADSSSPRHSPERESLPGTAVGGMHAQAPIAAATASGLGRAVGVAAGAAAGAVAGTAGGPGAAIAATESATQVGAREGEAERGGGGEGEGGVEREEEVVERVRRIAQAVSEDVCEQWGAAAFGQLIRNVFLPKKVCAVRTSELTPIYCNPNSAIYPFLALLSSSPEWSFVLDRPFCPPLPPLSSPPPSPPICPFQSASIGLPAALEFGMACFPFPTALTSPSLSPCLPFQSSPIDFPTAMELEIARLRLSLSAAQRDAVLAALLSSRPPSLDPNALLNTAEALQCRQLAASLASARLTAREDVEIGSLGFREGGEGGGSESSRRGDWWGGNGLLEDEIKDSQCAHVWAPKGRYTGWGCNSPAMACIGPNCDVRFCAEGGGDAAAAAAAGSGNNGRSSGKSSSSSSRSGQRSDRTSDGGSEDVDMEVRRGLPACSWCRRRVCRACLEAPGSGYLAGAGSGGSIAGGGSGTRSISSNSISSSSGGISGGSISTVIKSGSANSLAGLASAGGLGVWKMPGKGAGGGGGGGGGSGGMGGVGLGGGGGEGVGGVVEGPGRPGPLDAPICRECCPPAVTNAVLLHRLRQLQARRRRDRLGRAVAEARDWGCSGLDGWSGGENDGGVGGEASEGREWRERRRGGDGRERQEAPVVPVMSRGGYAGEREEEMSLAELPHVSLLFSVPTCSSGAPATSLLLPPSPPSTSPLSSIWRAPSDLSAVEIAVVLSTPALVSRIVVHSGLPQYTPHYSPKVRISLSTTIDQSERTSVGLWDLPSAAAAALSNTKSNPSESNPDSELILSYALPKAISCRIVWLKFLLPETRQPGAAASGIWARRIRVYGQKIFDDVMGPVSSGAVPFGREAAAVPMGAVVGGGGGGWWWWWWCL
ncbi:hypothetical protein CLOM_g2651 [Closterium sp. NIES-68]|nr:hypothetical protein CLOM_g2651 [Closterium sp. NIES-68]